ncbi:Pepco domain-containing protein [Jannaschia aquimarina]|uniref:Pepco domain-containing protein n=1 Tax=Jannaschia aquimarina TaxID=935700 RepID=A0A0D1CPD1_9RHOB|nr:hypothetical protein [Jannaschia aquimarina]KIT16622.1 hypothetical protein jaqu_15890 [Jannaschia aquimarina]SNS94056.1 hypothetical protein SAMN05421775_103392 [Jannaschia aquimarina]
MAGDDFIIIGATPLGDERGGGVASTPGTDEFQSNPLDRVRRWFGPSAAEVPTERLIESLEKTQGAIDRMVAKLDAESDAAFRLEAFEVSLGLSGKGDIGIVTATAQAGVKLTFKRAAASTG